MDILGVLGLSQPAAQPHYQPQRPSVRRESFQRAGFQTRENRKGLRSILQEGVSSNDTVTLTASECRALLRIMEDADRDPFTYRDDQFTDKDLSAVGVEVEAEAGQDDHDNRSPISPYDAVRRPENHPAEDAPPPPELGDALKTLNGDPSGDGGKDYDAIAMALVTGGGGSDEDSDDGLGGYAPPKPANPPSVQSESVDAVNALAVMRRKMKKEAQARKASGVSKKVVGAK